MAKFTNRMELLASTPLKVLPDGQEHRVWGGDLSPQLGPICYVTDEDSNVIREMFSLVSAPVTKCGFARCITPDHILNMNRIEIEDARGRLLKNYKEQFWTLTRMISHHALPLQLHYLWQGAYDALREFGFTHYNAIRLLQQDPATRRVPKPREPGISNDALLQNIYQDRYRQRLKEWEYRWGYDFAEAPDPDHFTVKDEDLWPFEPKDIPRLSVATQQLNVETAEQAISLFLENGETPPPELLRELERARLQRRRAELERRLSERRPTNGYH